MKRNHKLTVIAAGLGMLVLILDSSTALQGAKDGLTLSLQVVVPSLFPFFFLSVLLSGALVAGNVGFLRPLGWLFGVEGNAVSFLIPGILGGYPAGAQSIAAGYESGNLEKKDAENLLSFCNNAGPSFLFGMIGPMFPAPYMIWLLWGIHLFGAMYAARLFPCSAVAKPTAPPLSPTKALKKSILLMATVCGWIVLFRVLITFLDRWVLWLLPYEVQTLVHGLLELSNGVCCLPQIADVRVRFFLCSVLLGFGGLCVTMQTASAAGSLSIRKYLFGKAIQTAVSAALCCAILWGQWAPTAVLSLFAAAVLGKKEKMSSNPRIFGV